jgi:hypothetical protein
MNITLPDHIRAQWPYAPRFAQVNGWRMHYIDEGPGDPIVLLGIGDAQGTADACRGPA